MLLGGTHYSPEEINSAKHWFTLERHKALYLTNVKTAAELRIYEYTGMQEYVGNQVKKLTTTSFKQDAQPFKNYQQSFFEVSRSFFPRKK